jgi:hypothetical protein
LKGSPQPTPLQRNPTSGKQEGKMRNGQIMLIGGRGHAMRPLAIQGMGTSAINREARWRDFIEKLG